MSSRLQVVLAACVLLALTTMNAAAQPAINLTGTYRCVQGCASGFEGRSAFVTQNGWNMNLVSEAGVPVVAWFDWFSPNTIWIDALHQGAVYSPDGQTIQFDRGTVWVRDQKIMPYAMAIADCVRKFRSYDPASQTYLGRDGVQYPCP